MAAASKRFYLKVDLTDLPEEISTLLQGLESAWRERIPAAHQLTNRGRPLSAGEGLHLHITFILRIPANVTAGVSMEDLEAKIVDSVIKSAPETPLQIEFGDLFLKLPVHRLEPAVVACIGIEMKSVGFWEYRSKVGSCLPNKEHVDLGYEGDGHVSIAYVAGESAALAQAIATDFKGHLRGKSFPLTKITLIRPNGTSRVISLPTL